jgi:hypothetical protein
LYKDICIILSLPHVDHKFTQDGVVEELCPNDKDSDWSLNFKRGMLTAFQNSMDSFDMETEVREVDFI